MKDKGFINIQGWMINKLNLKGNELILYAIIYGYSQDGKNKYRGSLTYIQSALKISRNTVIKLIKDLLEKGLIIKEENNNGNLYSANIELVENTSSAETELVSSAETELVSSAETEPNNNNTNNNYNNNILSKDNTDKSEIIIKEDKRDIDIELIIETLKDLNMGIIDDTIIKQRRYGKLIKTKMYKIKGFDGRFVDFIKMAYEHSDEYRKNHFRSLEKFYYNLANIVAGIKIKAEKPKARTGC